MVAEDRVDSGLLCGDLDGDWHPITKEQGSNGDFNHGAKGRVSLKADGTLTYTPAKRFKNSDSFSYTISDGIDNASATVSITLQDSGGGGGKGKPKK